MKISGKSIKAGSLTKNVLTDKIAEHLDLPMTERRKGATVDQSFMADVLKRLGGSPGGLGKYQLTESVFELLGLSYDSLWDTSEAKEFGGSTITSRAYSRIHSELTSEPRCFILNVADSSLGNSWETDHQVKYKFDRSVSGRRSLIDAGPGSYVLYYSTSNSTVNPKTFSGVAIVSYLTGSYRGNDWALKISNFVSLETPVKESDVTIEGWNKQNAITEIPFDLLKKICSAGDLDFERWRLDEKYLVETQVNRELGNRLPEFEVPKDFRMPDRNLLESSDEMLNSFVNEEGPTYEEDDDNNLRPPASVNSALENRASYAATNRLVELRAIDVATECLQGDGWDLICDRQKDGCGYDLEFGKSGEVLHVEVKGIKSSTVAFNVTPKERWRIETDPSFVLIAVTKALSATPAVSVFTRQQLFSFPIQPIGYRIVASAG